MIASTWRSSYLFLADGQILRSIWPKSMLISLNTNILVGLFGVRKKKLDASKNQFLSQYLIEK